MIITEPYATRTDGVELVRTYSDTGNMIRQVETGIIYAEAIDIVPLRYTYEETDEVVSNEPEPELDEGSEIQ